MKTADPSQMLAELRGCAYRLGMAFGGEAERAGTTKARLESFELFERCFFAVRVATALELRLRRAPLTTPEHAEPERAGPERPELERAEREEVERDRPEWEGDREREPASLPVLLRTLETVAADAAALAGPEPTALPTLRELLAEVTSGPNTPRSGGVGLRARPATSVSAPAPRPRPATGPPRR